MHALSFPMRWRPETDRLLGPTLEALQGGKALRGFDLLEMSETLAQTYARLDYLHPFREGNSRTLRTFTEQLARENGHRLDWGTTNVTPRSRDALYVARDMAVIQLRYPGLTADKMMSVDDRQEYEMAFQLHRYRWHDPLQEIIRRSLERGRDPLPYDRRMALAEVVREISAVAPIAANQAEQSVEDTRLAVLRHKAPVSEHERATDLRDWVVREGNMAALTDRLEQVESGYVTVRHDPGVPAQERLTALSEGIGRELSRQRGIGEQSSVAGRDDIDR